MILFSCAKFNIYGFEGTIISLWYQNKHFLRAWWEHDAHRSAFFCCNKKKKKKNSAVCYFYFIVAGQQDEKTTYPKSQLIFLQAAFFIQIVVNTFGKVISLQLSRKRRH